MKNKENQCSVSMENEESPIHLIKHCPTSLLSIVGAELTGKPKLTICYRDGQSCQVPEPPCVWCHVFPGEQGSPLMTVQTYGQSLGDEKTEEFEKCSVV